MDAVVLAVPDAAIAAVAQQIQPVEGTCVAHLSGATSLTALAPHRRVASLHPLVALTDAVTGAERLRGGWFAVAGDPVAEDLVRALHGRSFPLDDEQRRVVPRRSLRRVESPDRSTRSGRTTRRPRGSASASVLGPSVGRC